MSTTALLLLSAVSFNAPPRGILYDFSATWCRPCQQMSPIVSRLEREGLPVQKIDVDQNRALAQQYGVSSIPAFVLVIDGKVVDRTVGITSEAALRQMLAKIPPAVKEKEPERQREIRVKDFSRVADRNGKTGSPAAKSLFQLPSLPPLFRKKREVSIDDPMTERTEPAVIRANIDAKDSAPADSRKAGPRKAAAVASTTRIRVKDEDGINFGSGTVIDSRPGRTIILTCGHIFRELKTDSTIEVDVFDGDRPESYVAKLISFDAEADVGVIEIPTSAELPAAKVAAAREAARKGDPVVSIGCGGGDPPTEQHQQVTALNRYLGPANVECTGVPIQGRSGGGLFNSAGQIIGVCIAADQKERRGIYAGLQCVHSLLKQAKLSHLLEGSADSGTDSPSPNEQKSPDQTDDLLALAEQDSRASRRSPDTETKPGEPALEARVAQGRSRKSAPAQAQASESGEPLETETPAGNLGEAEVICIIRPIDKPNAASRVVVINRASTKFVSYLTGEMRRQPQPTMGTISFDPRVGEQSRSDLRGLDAGESQTSAKSERVEPRTVKRQVPRESGSGRHSRNDQTESADAGDATRIANAASAGSGPAPRRYRRSAASR